MPFYECVILARQEISATQVETLGDEMANVIAQGGGQVSKREYWGLRSLSYRMKKNRKAHYILFNVDSPAPAVKEMERQLGLNEDILRVLTIRVDALEEGPSAMMQAKSGREEREGRGERPRREFREGGFRGERDGGFRGEREGGFRGDRDGGFRGEREPRRSEGGE